VETDPSWALLALAVALVLALCGLVGWLVVTEPAAAARRWGPRSRPDSERLPVVRRDAPVATTVEEETAVVRLQRAAVVVNPTKFDDVGRVRRRVEEVCERHGWAAPLWLETTVEDPGLGQARRAVEEGVDVVCSLGGDGTVRTVASALIGTDVPLGLLPGGTGNLLARNLRIPIDSVENALTTALTGRDTAIDTCTLTLLRPTTGQLVARLADEDDPTENVELEDAVDDRSSDEVTEEHHFLVMAGLGFDAEVMAGAPEALKAKVGWAAYLVSGLRHLKGPQFVVDVTTAEGLELRRRVRSVVVGNVGRLTGGMMLLPDAKHDDGIMDMVLLSPDGLVGWAAAGVQIATRQRKGHHRVDHYTCTKVRVRSDKPVEIQLDGDTMGTASAMEITVDPGSLLVRLPA
jgi:diacylglycerol kinase (ATP)